MAATDIETLRELARLARLALSEEELARLAPELERVLAAFEILGQHVPRVAAELQTDEAPAAPRSADRSARTRGDEPLPSLPREILLAPAAASEDGFFVVPKTVGGER